MKGQTGKILRLDLTNKSFKTLDTKQYEGWGGGYGMGVAIWYDLVADKTISALDPRNAVLVMPGLFSGTIVPGSPRTAMVGLGPQGYPVEWFTWSNAGGRWGPYLKFAGWDGVVIEGVSKTPVWVNIIDSSVEILDATNFWGMPTFEAEKHIHNYVGGNREAGAWYDVKSGGRSTQTPAVALIGPAGENLVRMSVVQTDAGHAWGMGGLAAVWGSKMLKAISVLGTGGVEVADPKATLDDRLWSKWNYAANVDAPKGQVNDWSTKWLNRLGSHFAGHPGYPMSQVAGDAPPGYGFLRAPAACFGCHQGCGSKTSTGLGNETMCSENTLYSSYDAALHGKETMISGQATDLLGRLGLISYTVSGISMLTDMQKNGILGPGKKVDTDLDFSKLGDYGFIEDYMTRVAYRQEIGNDIADGWTRAAVKWGVFDQYEANGPFQEGYSGYSLHSAGPVALDWLLAQCTCAKDVNDHIYRDQVWRIAGYEGAKVERTFVTAEELAKAIADKTPPYNDARTIDCSAENMYTDVMARRASWGAYYRSYYKNSLGLCDTSFPDVVNPYSADRRGLTPDGEARFFKSVTGVNQSFVDGLMIGRKILNLARSILVMQGRTRAHEYPARKEYVKPYAGTEQSPQFLNGKWVYQPVGKRVVDKASWEKLLDYYYQNEGWDTKTGWPTRSTLETLGLKYAADDLAKLGKLP